MSNHTTNHLEPTQLAKATLYATFYADSEQKEKVEKVVACLSSDLNRFDTKQVDCKGWKNQDESRFLYHFPAFTTRDTTIIQLILNHNAPVTTAWADMYSKVKSLLHHPELKEQLGSSGDQMLKELSWGHTLIYQARLKQEDGIDLSQISRAGLKELLPTIRSLSPSQNQALQPLARSIISRSYLWLMDIPTQGEGFDAGMVYLTLAPSEKEADYMKNNVLVGPVATWLMPDLIAHKSYHQMRQYRLDNIPSNYKEQLKYMRQSAGQILQKVNPKALGLTGGVTPEIKQLPKQYGAVIGTRLPAFNDLRVSLERQLYNYQQWWEKKENGHPSGRVRPLLSEVGSDDILEYHQAQIETAVFELQAMAHEGENAIQAVQAAVDAVRTEIELKREEQQQMFNMLLTAVGLGLGTSQIVDKEAAGILLNLVFVKKIIHSIGLTATPTDPLHQFITQIVITIAVVIVVVVPWWVIIKRSR